MSANFLFFQVPNQTLPPDFGRGKMEVSEQRSSEGSKTCDMPSGDSRNSFLNTLEQISKDNQHNKTISGISLEKSSTSAATNSGDKFDTTCRHAIGNKTEIFEATKQLEENPTNVTCQIIPDSNLTVVSSIFENLGLYESNEGLSFAGKVNGILGNAEGSAALLHLLARLEQNDLVPSSEMKAVLVRLQQFIANAQNGDTLSPNDGNLLGELSGGRLLEHANLYQMVERIVSGQGDQTSSSSDFVSESDSGKKPSDPLTELNRIKTKLPNDIRQTGSLQPVENSKIAPHSGNIDKTDAIKLPVEPRPFGAEDNENAKVSRASEADRTKIFELKDVANNPVKAGTPDQASLVDRIQSTINFGKQADGESAHQNLWNNESTQILKMTNEVRSVRALNQVQLSAGENLRDEMVNNESSPAIKMTNNAQAVKPLDPVQRYGGEHIQNNAVVNESSPVLKMIHDAQLAKETHMRMDPGISDELSGKVAKVEAGTNGNGLLNSLNQSAEKAFETTSPSKRADNGAPSLRTQTLDQIVRRAAIHMRNGQHEAKIDLKPEFLGHVRMQVTTENHQVTVKILTEFGFVKDMVENNIHQLKTDLQQQGLNVDKLEVAVSNDSDEDKHHHGKADQAKDRQSRVARNNPGSREEETREQTENVGLRQAGTVTVDYFA